MIFNTAPYHPMEPEHEHDAVNKEIGLGVRDIGMSVPLGIAAADVQGVHAKLRQGTNALEIQFAGAGRGQRQQQTPGMWGDSHRKALEEMRKANDVEFTTHAAFAIGGLAGQDQQGNFSDEQQKFMVQEVKRAIEFAADAAGGGSVVIHTGEFNRPVSEEPWAEGGTVFKAYEEEPEKAVKRLVDRRTGQVIQNIRKNQIVARAEWNTFGGDTAYVDEKGQQVSPGDYVDYEGNKVDFKNRLPKYNTETGRFEVQEVGWQEMVKEAHRYNERKADELGISVAELPAADRVTPEEAFLYATTETQEAVAKGWEAQYGNSIKDDLKDIEKLKKSLAFYQELEAKTPKEEVWKIMRQDSGLKGRAGFGISQQFVPQENKLPSDMIKDALLRTRENIEASRDMSMGQAQQAREQAIVRENTTTAEKYALERSFNSYADAGMHAFDQTLQKHTEKPVVVTMEHIFPEQYGGHPEELRTLISGSRQKMAQKLVQRGYAQNEAKEYAETHLKGTLDTGHLNIWRKHWQGKPEEFNTWVVNEVEKLAKGGYIGNLHLSDNYGYEDEHLSPGQGNAPVREIVRVLKKHGYQGPVTVEPGADAQVDLSDFHGLMKTWRYFGSSVYGFGGAPNQVGPPGQWQDVQHSYFGRAYPPNFIFGAYSPSNEWTLWSQVPME